jgi:hypothetical protein
MVQHPWSPGRRKANLAKGSSKELAFNERIIIYLSLSHEEITR